MSNAHRPQVAIVDYGMGNLFSIMHACKHVGLNSLVTTSPEEIAGADAVILPGVGAFGDAMESLQSLHLVDTLREISTSNKPLFGVCLGMQLLMAGSTEFGNHAGLGVIPGRVVKFEGNWDTSAGSPGRTVKVPHVGWNRIACEPERQEDTGRHPDGAGRWTGSFLEGLNDGEYMYFVHSFYVEPDDPSMVLASSRYGEVNFCACLQYRNIFACQFHPERSGPQGIHIYQNLARMLALAS